MKGRPWQVLIADLKSSRKIPARERPRVDRALRRAISRVVREYRADFRLVPEVLKGDELQAVLRPDAPAVSILTYLRARITVETGLRIALRAGVGRGAILRLSSKGPFASEGEAFHRARAALDRAKAGGSGSLTAWDTGDVFFDALAHAVLGLGDAFVSRWTGPQWEAISGRLERKGLHAIARQEGVSFQSVSKRLRAAAWNEVRDAFRLLEAMAASAAAGTPRRARGPRTVQPARAESRRSPTRG